MGLTVTLKRGNTFKREFRATKDGAAVDLSTCTGLTYLVKRRLSDLDADAALTFTTTLADGAQLVVTDAADGRFQLQATATATRELACNSYHGALQLTTAAGELVEFPSDGAADNWVPSGDVILANT